MRMATAFADFYSSAVDLETSRDFFIRAYPWRLVSSTAQVDYLASLTAPSYLLSTNATSFGTEF